MVLPAATLDGKKSRIVPALTEGAGVVMTRGGVQYVVTEYGVAYLHGKSVRERALALISIAHPDFRDELMEAAQDLRYIERDSRRAVTAKAIYPYDWEQRPRYSTASNRIFFRPAKSTDERALKEFFLLASQAGVLYPVPLVHEGLPLL